MAHPLREQFIEMVGRELPIDVSKDLERGVFNWCIEQCESQKIIKNWKNPRFMHLYKDKARSVVSNLSDEGYIANLRLKKRLLDKEFPAHRIPYMKPENVFPERWAAILDTQMKKNMHVFEEKPVAMTNEFKCGKCKEKKCIYQELQVRSADEAMTIFITCLNCGHKWKI